MASVLASCALVGSLILTSMPHGSVGVEKYKGCLPGWLHYKDVCYFIKGGHVSYDTAKSECDNLGGKLAAVDITTHLDFVHSQLHIKCVDQNEDCPAFADQGSCLSDHAYMKENCRYSCGFCSSFCENDLKSTEDCKIWAGEGDCYFNPKYMMKYCRQSCGCDGYSDNYWIRQQFEVVSYFFGLHQQLEGPFCYQLHVTGERGRKACDADNGAGFICERDAEQVALSKLDEFHVGCPVNGFGYKTNCYILNHVPSTWHGAVAMCEKKSGTLASIPNLEVLEFVTAELLTQVSTAWIGLARDSENQYTWTSGDHVTYLPWAADFDGSQIDDCVQIEPKENNTVFSPAGCSDLQASVCEVPRATQSDKDDESQESEVEFSDCAQDWVEHGEFCYKLFTEKKSWQDAQNGCEQLKGDLISIHNANTQDILNSFEEDTVWIGLNKEGTDEVFEWSDGSAFDYNHWDKANYRPNRLEKQCVQAGSGSKTKIWTGKSCGSTFSYVCQRWRGHPPMALPTDKPTTEGTDTRVEEEPEETTTQMAKADSPTSQGTSKKEEDDSEDTIPDIHPPKELEPWTTLSTTTELDGSLVTGNYPGEDDRIQRVQEAEQHRDYQKEKSVRSSLPIAPEQIVGILIGCAVFVAVFSLIFVYVSRNSRKSPAQMFSSMARSLSIRYNPSADGGEVDGKDGRRTSSIEEIQEDPSFGSDNPYASPILFVDGKAEVQVQGGDMESGPGIGFENHMYNISDA